MAGANVGLVTHHLVWRLAHAHASELHAAIYETFRAHQLVLEPEHKVPVPPRCRQKLVTWIALQRSSDNRTLTDAPHGGIAVPTAKVAPVKQLGLRGGRSCHCGGLLSLCFLP